MKVIPAVDVKDGKCVQLVGGKPGTEKVSIDDVDGVARKWQAEGAEMVHIIDLDSALGTGNNECLIEALAASLTIPVQVGGGVRTEEKVERLFEMGCERVIVGTRAIQDRQFIERVAADYPDGIVVAIDSAEDQVLIKGWQESSGKPLLDVVRDLENLPIFGFLYTNVDVEGRLEGINPDPIKALMTGTKKPVIVSGGITTLGDLDALQKMGAHSAVVGMAIYTGRIDFKKAVRMFT
ncbi:MAG: 1-(5-phosphoribosyl)-5-[(5-phosphoribosylamino)methylideneamino]imidazole-4-carboxamide isomerase [Thermoplasmata archaeon]|jgi:phosphoribosylformimino-5-aminoimidazole carboxamide ribotide isomerase|nr:1-(5-phosphoribosyl)-5-[(5-phosphoribosylamino)methylideneamino]imidazole-4-carboxamide isomerase [Thermoplasmata archaeon]